MRNRYSGVSMMLLLLLWEEGFPGFCFSRKIAISLGDWSFIERTHTFMGQQAEGSQLSSLTVVQTVSFQQGSCGKARGKSASISEKESHGKEPRF